MKKDQKAQDGEYKNCIEQCDLCARGNGKIVFRDQDLNIKHAQNHGSCDDRAKIGKIHLVKGVEHSIKGHSLTQGKICFYESFHFFILSTDHLYTSKKELRAFD
jgi:hypothetical protein